MEGVDSCRSLEATRGGSRQSCGSLEATRGGSRQL